MEKRRLGKKGPQVNSIGYGCMGLSPGHYGTSVSHAEGCRIIEIAYHECGVDFFDTADLYASGANEKLVGEALKPFRHKVVLASKCALTRVGTAVTIDNSPDYIKAACDRSLERLDTDYIDLYYLHRKDKMTPIEDVAGAMLELIAAGKIRYVGLSEANADTIRRAHAVLGDKLIALQTEYSVRNRLAAQDVLPVCRELGISFVPYSPISRGFLSGTLKDASVFTESKDFDYRSLFPQFQAGALEKNLGLVRAIERLASQKDISATQLSLAWLLAQGHDLIPIPGTSKVAHLKENMASASLSLSAQDLSDIEKAYRDNPQEGLRFPESLLAMWGAKY